MKLLSSVWLLLVSALVPGLLGASAPLPANPDSVKALAEKYWSAEVRQDYATVYDLLSPDVRAAEPRDRYVALRRTEGPYQYLSARVGAVELAGTLAWTHVVFDWTVPKFRTPPRAGESWQLWRYQDGWFPIMPNDRENWPALPPSLRPVADEAALSKRVAGMWEAKAAQDWRAVYGYLPPEWRSRVALDEFLNVRAKFVYLSPKIEWVEADGRGHARARVSFASRINDPAVSKAKPQPSSVIEPWVRVDGEWYIDTSVLEAPQASAASNAGR